MLGMKQGLGVLFVAAGLAGLAAGATPALAHGPTRQKLDLAVDVNAPPAKVWAVIGNFQDLSWVPAVAKVQGSGGNDPNLPAKRSITLKSGGVIADQELESYDAAKFTYGTFLPHVDPKVLPVNDYSDHLVVTDAGGGKSHVEWRSAFYRGYMNNSPPPGQDEAAAVAAVTAICQPALDALKARFGAGH